MWRHGKTDIFDYCILVGLIVAFVISVFVIYLGLYVVNESVDIHKYMYGFVLLPPRHGRRYRIYSSICKGKKKGKVVPVLN
jgi:hypothetical protein